MLRFTTIPAFVLSAVLIARASPTLDLPDLPAPATTQPTQAIFPIDLDTCLRLAENENPRIAGARMAILEAQAWRQRACAMLLPSLNAGSSYHGHDGNLQRPSGRILSLSEQSLYVGGGARAIGSQTIAIPAVLILAPLTDALFEPLAARRKVEAARESARATANDVFLEVAVLYQELACAAANLKTQRELMPNVEEVARITRDFALAGEGRAADADRALTERNLLIAEIQKTEGSLFAASARLAERLNLDPTTRLVPASQDFQALTIIDDRLPIADLIRVAVNQRPELAEGDAMIAEAGARVQQERWRPWLPTLWMGGSGGVFGGGSNLVPPTIGNFGGRTDFDVRAFWTLLNFGAGNRALQRQRMAERGQAVARRQASLNLVREQIASAQAGSIAARAQIDQRARAVLLAEEGFNQDLARTREGQGRPIEVLNNLNRLVRARLDLNISVLDYVSEQLRLYVALGSPPPPTGFSTGTSGGTSLTTSPSAR